MKKLTLIVAILSLALLSGVQAAAWCDGADVNHNGQVDTFDKDIFAAYYTVMADCTAENNQCQGLDFDGNGRINTQDLGYFGDRYGRTDCIGDSIPPLNPTDTWCEGADVDHNGAVDEFDEDIFGAYFKAATNCTEENAYCQGLDFDGNGRINTQDLGYFGDQRGRTDCGPQVPEFGLIAGMIALIGGLGGFILLRRK